MADRILTVGPAPHLKSGANTVRNHYAMAVALLPGAAAAVYLHGLKALIILLLAVSTAVASEALAQYFMRQPLYALDGHGILTGLILALLLPPTVPWWVVVIGAALASLVAKQIFGGLGCYPFHPALIGYLILLLSWPHHIAPVGGVQLGTACVWAIMAGGIVIWVLGFVNRLTPLAFLAGLIASSALFHALYPASVPDMWRELSHGSAWLAAFFLITDETSSPANCVAKVLYGVLVGVLLMLIRVYGIWMEVVPFAILLGNMVSPLLDLIRPKTQPMEKVHA